MDLDLASKQEARDLVARTRRAFETFRHFSQEMIDDICFAAVEAGFRESRRLAEMAVAETGFGRVEGKFQKNAFSTRGLWEYIRDLRTAGLVAADDARGLYDYADPFGVVAAIIPTTNPTSTALFKALICLKSRNGMVCSPHPRAAKCIAEAIRVIHDAATAAGAPRDILTCMTTVSLEGTEELMQAKGIDLILATGGSGLVKAAYSSGKPAFGVGPGNAPAYVDRSADAAHAAHCLVESQTFDNSTICASEQSLVIDRPIRDALLFELKKRRAHHCSPTEAKLLERIVMKGRGMNPDIVGRYPHELANMAGFNVAKETTILLADCDGVGFDHPLSIEKLSPILSMFTVDGWEAGCERSIEVLRFGGMGHTLALHCTDQKIIREFAEKKPVNRLVVNSPSAQGAVGYTTNLVPSMTLGCGSFGGNITSDNIGPLHLLNIKRLAYVKPGYGTPAWIGDFKEPLPPRHRTDRPEAAGPSGAGVWPSRHHGALAAPKDTGAHVHGDGCGHGHGVSPSRPDVQASNMAPVTREDVERLVASLLAAKGGTCALGRCSDCPPAGTVCHHGQTAR